MAFTLNPDNSKDNSDWNVVNGSIYTKLEMSQGNIYFNYHIE